MSNPPQPSATPSSSPPPTPPASSGPNQQQQPPKKPARQSRLPFDPSPEQLAAIEAKRAARAAAKAAAPSAAGGEGGEGGGAAPKRSKEQIEAGKFLQREWVDLPGTGGKKEREGGGKRVRVVSWNMLAQTLVRRELFPGSDCLKWSDRHQMLLSELLSYTSSSPQNPADIICLQEVDRLPPLLPFLSPTHSPTSAKGRGKQHGLVILHRKEGWEKKGERVVWLDEEFVREEEREEGREGEEMGEKEKESKRRGGTRETKNIGLMVALERKDGSGEGVIAVTTHLFWHPTYTYERTRQLSLLRLVALSFRSSLSLPHWPIIMAGDFNTQPFEPCYGLMMNPTGELGKTGREGWEGSRVVHDSVGRIGKWGKKDGKKVGRPEWVDPGVGGVAGAPTPGSAAKEGEQQEAEEGEEEDDEGEGEGEGDGSKGTGSTKEPMRNTRAAEDKDGLLTLPELRELFSRGRPEAKEGEKEVPGVTSVYEEASRLLAIARQQKEQEKVERALSQLDGRLLGDRLAVTKGDWELMESGDGAGGGEIGKGEPNWTSFTPLWRLTLDYIFLLPPSVPNPRRPRVVKILQPHRTEDLEPGLPRKGVSASDHVAVGGEIVF